MWRAIFLLIAVISVMAFLIGLLLMRVIDKEYLPSQNQPVIIEHTDGEVAPMK
jgi:predicted MFS family arabinose efflux permease